MYRRFAKRAVFCFRGFLLCFLREFVVYFAYLAYRQKYADRYYQKVHDGNNKQPVVERCGVRGGGGLYIFVFIAVERDKKVLEFYFADNKRQKGHDYVVDQGRHYFSERAAYNHAYRHIYYIALEYKFFEIFKHIYYPRFSAVFL